MFREPLHESGRWSGLSLLVLVLLLVGAAKEAGAHAGHAGVCAHTHAIGNGSTNWCNAPGTGCGGGSSCTNTGSGSQTRCKCVAPPPPPPPPKSATAVLNLTTTDTLPGTATFTVDANAENRVTAYLGNDQLQEFTDGIRGTAVVEVTRTGGRWRMTPVSLEFTTPAETLFSRITGENVSSFLTEEMAPIDFDIRSGEAAAPALVRVRTTNRLYQGEDALISDAVVGGTLDADAGRLQVVAYTSGELPPLPKSANGAAVFATILILGAAAAGVLWLIGTGGLRTGSGGRREE